MQRFSGLGLQRLHQVVSKLGVVPYALFAMKIFESVY